MVNIFYYKNSSFEELAKEHSPQNTEPEKRSVKEKRGPGRPPGSKNKKTLEREEEQKRLAEQGLLPPKRKRGRSPGSKNKKTLEREAKEEQLHKRRPGRPQGSKNKKRFDQN